MELETLASGYGLIEGPRVDARGNLYFSDVRGGGVYRRSPGGAIDVVVPRRKGVGGIVLHADGGLVISGRDICHVRDGESRVLFRRDDIPGFNDIFADARGRVLAGSIRANPFDSGGASLAGELWRIDAPGQATELYADVALSNGIGLSPGGERLYHCDSARRQILVHEVAPDGRVGSRRVFAELSEGAPDGLAVDAEGGVWVAVYGGGRLERRQPDGTLDRAVEVPATAVTSLCFGGEDGRDLYIVTADNAEVPERGGSIFRARADVAGLPAPLARV